MTTYSYIETVQAEPMTWLEWQIHIWPEGDTNVLNEPDPGYRLISDTGRESWMSKKRFEGWYKENAPVAAGAE